MIKVIATIKQDSVPLLKYFTVDDVFSEENIHAKVEEYSHIVSKLEEIAREAGLDV